MASTFSKLKFELIGTGEQDGTWGITTNTNLGTAIEEAIAGRANANFGSDVDLTLTLTNTATTQVARHYVLNVTSSGSLTATRNLIVPSIEKPYLIENNTSGGQDIVVKTAAGTGVTVPNGARTLVYTNGTDVVSAVNYIPTLALGTIVGTLPVANGGTGATSLTANNVLLGNGTSALQVVAPGTSGNVLTSNGTTWASSQVSTIAQGNTSVEVTDTGSNGTITLTTEGTTRLTVNASGVVDIPSRNLSKGSLPAGTVLQVVEATTSTEVAGSSTTYVDTGLSATITPTSASSKILVIVNQQMALNAAGGVVGATMKLLRGSTVIVPPVGNYDISIIVGGATQLSPYYRHTISKLDSPSTTSATTYKTQIAAITADTSYFMQEGNVGLSTIILMEIAG